MNEHKRGTGALSIPQQNGAIDMLLSGKTQREVAQHYGVTKNTISGIWSRAGYGKPAGPDPTTAFDRCEALHRRMDAVLAATRGVGRIPNEVKG